MLKIKNNIDLKVLKKYGYKTKYLCYEKETKDGNLVRINDVQCGDEKGIIYIQLISKPNKLFFPFTIKKENIVSTYVEDLINDGLVEKVSD